MATRPRILPHHIDGERVASIGGETFGVLTR